MTWAETVLRPGRARPYRARKRPYAEMLGGDWDDGSVVVWRTHDVDVAVALAHRLCESYGVDVLPSPQVGWFRVVPWDVTGGGYDYSVEDAAPTERAATPGVWFR